MAVRRRGRRARPPEDHPPRHAVNLLLASAMISLVPHLPRLPPWLWLVTLCLILWRYIIENHGWRAPGSVVRITVVLATVFLVYRHYGTLLGRDAGIALLIALMGLKMLELRRLRDYMLNVFLIYFVVLGGFLHSQSPWIALYALVVASLTSVCLIKLSQPQSLPLGEAVRTGVVLMAKAVPLMLILYLLFPRIQGSLWGLPMDAYGGVSGVTDRLSIGTIHSLTDSSKVAFRAEFDGPPPASSDLYWRAMVLSETDGTVWTRRHRFTVRHMPRADDDALWRYTVTLEPTNQQWLVALDHPVSAPAGAVLYNDLTVQSLRPLRERLRYTASSKLPGADTSAGPEERRRNLELPVNPGARVTSLARGWRARAQSDAEIVRQAMRFFREQEFKYTLSPAALVGDNPVDEFLFETREGFCEHFAASFTTLMRAAHVPARIVVGYQGGEFNEAGDYMIVRQSDAHAWAEVWLPGSGWTRFDPTAAVSPARVELGFDAFARLEAGTLELGPLEPGQRAEHLSRGWVERQIHHLSLYWDAANRLWDGMVLEYGSEQQKSLLARLGFETPTGAVMVGTMAAAVTALMLAFSAFMLMRRARVPTALAWYRRFLGKLERVGVRHELHEGPLDFARRAALLHPALAREIGHITELYVAARYAEQLEATAELKRSVRRFVARGRATGSSSRSDSGLRS